MKSYLAYTAVTLRLTLRDRVAFFFNYIFPLMFFFIFAESLDARQGGFINQVVTMVLILGVLGNGLFGAGVRAVQDRELNILRRFKVTPISPAPILAASMITGWVVFMPAVLLILGLAHLLYGMPVPERLLSLLLLVSLGVIAFRALGLIIASVVNSTQENAIIIQLLYLPMLFLSGATFPIAMLPEWAQAIVQFLPASYLSIGLQGILIRGESLWVNGPAIMAMALTTLLATFLSMKLFRWEKEQKLPASAKLWVAVVLLPFFALGAYEMHSRENVSKARELYRELRRSRTMLIRDARIFIGDGRVIESGAVLVRQGKVHQVFEGAAPDPTELRADVVEASGKTLLPGLIDAQTNLGEPGGFYDASVEPRVGTAMRRAAAAYLYSGVTAVATSGGPLEEVVRIRSQILSGEWLGAELFVAAAAPDTQWADGIQVIPDGDDAVLREELAKARKAGLPAMVRARDARELARAVEAGAEGIVCGLLQNLVPEELFAEMARKGVAWNLALSVAEAVGHFAAGDGTPLQRSLVLQVGPAELVEGTRKALRSAEHAALRVRLAAEAVNLDLALDNLRRAHEAGVTLVAGSGAGSLMVFHGPAIHRELQLWVQAGVSPPVALKAATYNAARLLRRHGRVGSIQPGRDADLLLVDGNPLQDITATERISLVIFKGERIGRPELFEQRRRNF